MSSPRQNPTEGQPISDHAEDNTSKQTLTGQVKSFLSKKKHDIVDSGEGEKHGDGGQAIMNDEGLKATREGHAGEDGSLAGQEAIHVHHQPANEDNLAKAAEGDSYTIKHTANPIVSDNPTIVPSACANGKEETLHDGTNASDTSAAEKVQRMPKDIESHTDDASQKHSLDQHGHVQASEHETPAHAHNLAENEKHDA